MGSITLAGRQIGLSPLARGTRGSAVAAGPSSRFIPAGAGNTLLLDGYYRTAAVYPRWRGEHVLVSIFEKSVTGLSPLARGTLNNRGVIGSSLRFIPAGAGNTPSYRRPALPCSVYPRWRGEHSLSRIMRHGSPGLSPLARGTHCCGGCRGDRHRFIPAGAGNTVAFGTTLPARSVYPRWRGEHSFTPSRV